MFANVVSVISHSKDFLFCFSSSGSEANCLSNEYLWGVNAGKRKGMRVFLFGYRSKAGIIGSMGSLQLEGGQSNDLNAAGRETPAGEPHHMSLV